MQEMNEEEWQNVEQLFVKRFEKECDLQAMLYLIGINEYGHLPQRKKFTKDQKQDLIHVAVCSLLSQMDYFMFEKVDEEGWPHFLPLKKLDAQDLESQELLLKKAIILYFKNRNEL